MITTTDQLYDNICSTMLYNESLLNNLYETYGWMYEGFYNELYTREQKHNDTCLAISDIWEGQTEQEILSQWSQYASEL